ncbi:MAG: serine/threonine-protein kinase [Cyanobacteria bacterium J06560_6]
MGPDDRNYTPTAIAAPLGRRYQVIASLGSGSFGETFLAADLHLPGQPRCVVKQLQPTVRTERSLQIARRLFETEANVLARLGEHPQIPRLLAHFEEKEEFYLVQELIEGQDLSAELPTVQTQTGQTWSDSEAIAFLHDLLNTLSFVHDAGVIHRDIKPSNLIRRQQDRRIVLIDFGAVKQVGTQLVADPSGLDPNASQPGASRTIAIGTEGYMPPEQIAGHPQFSSDIYAVGIIAIQALTGQLPSRLERNPNTGEIDWHHLSLQVRPALKNLIDTMVRYDFRTRYNSASAALTALRAMLSASTSAVNSSAEKSIESTDRMTPAVGSAEAGLPEAIAANSVSSASDVTQTVSLSDRQKDETAAKTWLAPFVVGVVIATMLGVGVIAGQRLPGWLGLSGTEEAVEREAAEQEKEKEAAEREVAKREAAAERARAEREAAEREAAERERAERERAEREAAEREAAEREAAERDADGRAAIATIETLYQHISNKDWDQTTLLFSPEQAERFRPGFFEKFEQVTVENLQITYQTADIVELVGQNTFVYPDGGLQIEERVYTVQTAGGEPLVTDTELLQVLQPRE